MSDSDEDKPQLSASTLAVLQEFYAQQEAYEADERVSVRSGDPIPQMPKEDWQLSQFWYEEVTAEVLAKEAVDIAGEAGSIACVSCPTLYHKIRELKSERCKAVILEYDTRFERFKEDFVFYDYNNPTAIPGHLKNAFDVVVADPPFLAEDCLTKTAITVRLLAKGKIILCTGAVMEETAAKLLGVKTCQFIPRHSNNLANEFRCYINYDTSKYLQ